MMPWSLLGRNGQGYVVKNAGADSLGDAMNGPAFSRLRRVPQR